jgi:hypothetical protein
MSPLSPLNSNGRSIPLPIECATKCMRDLNVRDVEEHALLKSSWYTKRFREKQHCEHDLANLNQNLESPSRTWVRIRNTQINICGRKLAQAPRCLC